MSYVFRSSNAAEAGFVVAFFREKGFSATINANAAIYGMQAYDVVVQEDVSQELEGELKARLQSIGHVAAIQDESTEAITEPAPDSSKAPPFSIVQILIIMIVATFVFQGIFFSMWKFSRNQLGDMFNGVGLSIIAYIVMALFIFAYVRRKLGSGIKAFFGLDRDALRPILLWSAVSVVWTCSDLFLMSKLSIPHQATVASTWPLHLIVIPVCYGIFNIGFLARSLELLWGRVPAVILSPVILFILSWLQHFSSGSPLRIVTLLILVTARLQSGSAYPAAVMMAVAWLVHFPLQ